jgi:hypothetical protein
MLSSRLAWWPLPPDDQEILESLIPSFLAAKRFEASQGFTLNEEIPVLIAAEACLLIVGLDLSWYRDVSSVIVYPSVATRSGRRTLGGGLETADPVHLAGEAMLHGPVMIVWDQLLGAARHPEHGRNVVFHEFAHKLDMADGTADGIPYLAGRDEYHRWSDVMGQALEDVRNAKPRFIDPYGAVGPVELFAVVTEAFFDVPTLLLQREPDIYALLSDFYRQDPAAR